jgi:outer membrane lipoprotein-sorting protein
MRKSSMILFRICNIGSLFASNIAVEQCFIYGSLGKGSRSLIASRFINLKINIMNFLSVPVLALAALTVSLAVKAQTVDEIVNKHIEAVGGKDKLNSMKSLYVEADMEVMGNQASSTTTVLYGKGSLSEIDFGGQKIVNCVTIDKGGWSINPMAGQVTAEPMPEAQANAGKSQLYPCGALLDYTARGNKVELDGQEDINGVKAWKLKVTTKDGANQVHYIDPNTWYIVKSVSKMNTGGQDIEQGITFSDYKKTDYGFVAPYTSAIELPQGMTLNVTIRKIEVNKEIDPKIFDKP